MASDPRIRHAIIENLHAIGGTVTAPTFGALVAIVAPSDVSKTQAKRAVNSLAHSSLRERRVSITRQGGQGANMSGVPGDIQVKLLR